MCASAQKEFNQIFPRPGWVEHDAREIWSSQIGVAHEVLARAGAKGKDIAAVGIANQRETTVIWQRSSGQPIANAIVWQDRRTAEACERLRADGLAPLISARTGLVLDAYFSASKIRWLLDHVPGAQARAEAGELAFGTIDSWLIWNLTNGATHVTDPSNAARTMLFNIHDGVWDDELLNLFGVPRQLLPEVRESSAVTAHTASGMFSCPLPIAGIAGDQQAALFGQMCTRAGMAKNTYGTGCFMLLNTGLVPVTSAHRLLTTVAWKRAGQTDYALEGSVFSAGAVVQWLRDGLGIIRSASDIEALARSVPDSGGAYCVPAFAGLGAPHWDASARGAILGLTRGTSGAHIARAALESIAFQVADVLEAMQHDAQLELSELRVDGGASVNDLLMQFQADLLGVPVARPKITEATALGAAYLAGIAVGFWENEEEVALHHAIERRFDPDMDTSLREELRAGWHKALARAMDWESAP